MPPRLDLLLSVGDQMPCKACGAEAVLYGVVDFNKSCEENRGNFLPLIGIPVYYHRCPACGLVFTSMFDHWPMSYFAKHIYNDEYALVDPDYLDRRPANNANLVANFIRRGDNLSVLDYGGGNGKLAAMLRDRAILARSWDPMVDPGQPPPGKFDVVTAFEVFEHTPNPVETCAQALSSLSQGGVLLFSTLTLDNLPPGAVHHWYIAPRNGHVTIYSKESLNRLFARFGYKMHHFSDLLHVALREVPPWLA